MVRLPGGTRVLNASGQTRRKHRQDVWGVKTQFASRKIRICRRNAGFETPQAAIALTLEAPDAIAQ